MSVDYCDIKNESMVSEKSDSYNLDLREENRK